MLPASAHLLELLSDGALADVARQPLLRREARHLQITSLDDAQRLLGALADWSPTADDDVLVAELLTPVWRWLQSRNDSEPLPAAMVDRVVGLYGRWRERLLAAHHLLRLLAAAGDEASLAAFADLVANVPPQKPDHALLVFVPLFQRSDYDPRSLFPRLLDALEHPQLASVVLDLANYLTRRGRLAGHPAASRGEQLANLLGAVVLRLQRVEERPQEFGSSPRELSELVGDGVSLIVSLCDALALIGNTQVTGKLHQTLELRHRRVRVEAAAALARLGDERGVDVLIEMAAEPVVRSRVLAYAQELQVLDRVAAEHRTDEARAAGAMAAWLAEPVHFGSPPPVLDLVDTCTLAWPGYDKPVTCYLFTYEYPLEVGSLTGVGIAGPVTHALLADLEDLPPADIYAIYAGWHAQHEEIGETPADQLGPHERAQWETVRSGLENAGYEQPTLDKLGRFIDDEHWVATARRQGRSGVVVVAGERIDWYPIPASRRPLGPTEFYYLHKGRKILRTFNAS